MEKLIQIFKNYKITEVSQIQIIIFWITLILSLLTILFMVFKY